MSSVAAVSWATLPAEMQLAVVDNLAQRDLLALARTDRTTYATCIPALFQVWRTHTPFSLSR
jgi:hypothetical protein